MRKYLDIVRRVSADEPKYRQRFLFETDDEASTVASALREINARPDLTDVDGNPAAPVRWEHACLQRKCGACAMLICGVARLACDTPLASLQAEVITLAPLQKFPIIADLIVDRSAMFDQLTALGTWLDEDGANLAAARPRTRTATFEASRCIQCGCCLEVCPNVGRMDGSTTDVAGGNAKAMTDDAGSVAQGGGASGPRTAGTDVAFAGMAGMVPLARLLAAGDAVDRGRIASSYRAGVYGGCGRSLACRDICPAHIDIAGLMSRSNAVAVWRRMRGLI